MSHTGMHLRILVIFQDDLSSPKRLDPIFSNVGIVEHVEAPLEDSGFVSNANDEQMDTIAFPSEGLAITSIMHDPCTRKPLGASLFGGSGTPLHGACSGTTSIAPVVARSISAAPPQISLGEDFLLRNSTMECSTPASVLMSGKGDAAVNVEVATPFSSTARVSSNCEHTFSSHDYGVGNFSSLNLSQDDAFAKNSVSPVLMSTPVSKSFSKDEVIAFGGIQSEKAKGVRSSGRLRAQHNADATQLERAMSIAQRRDDVFAQGTVQTQSRSLLSFSDSQIIHNASILGVSLGNSDADKLASARLIKENEVQRTLTILNNDTVSEKRDDPVKCLVVTRASALSGDLDDDESLFDDGFQPVLKKKKHNKKKKSYDKTKVRRSNRIRTKTQ